MRKCANIVARACLLYVSLVVSCAASRASRGLRRDGVLVFLGVDCAGMGVHVHDALLDDGISIVAVLNVPSDIGACSLNFTTSDRVEVYELVHLYSSNGWLPLAWDIVSRSERTILLSDTFTVDIRPLLRFSKVMPRGYESLIQYAPDFVSPTNGDIVRNDHLYDSMTITWDMSTVLSGLDTTRLVSRIDEEKRRWGHTIFARVEKATSSGPMSVQVPLTSSEIFQRKGSFEASGKIYGSHVVSVQLLWENSEGTSVAIGSKSRCFFDVVPTHPEAVDPDIISVNRNRVTHDEHVLKRHASLRVAQPRVLFVCGVASMNGQMALYVEQCRRLPRAFGIRRKDGHDRFHPGVFGAVDWLSLTSIHPNDTSALQTQRLVEDACDRLYHFPLVLHKDEVSYLSREIPGERNKVRALLAVLKRTKDLSSIPEPLRSALQPIIVFLSTYHVVVFENEQQQYFAELLRLAKVRARILSITRPEFDANYAVHAIVVSSSYVLTKRTLRNARREKIASFVVSPGADVAHHFTRERFEENMRRIELAKGSLDPIFRIGFAGRLVSEKSPAMVLRTVRTLISRAKGVHPHRIVLDIVGVRCRLKSISLVISPHTTLKSIFTCTGWLHAPRSSSHRHSSGHRRCRDVARTR